MSIATEIQTLMDNKAAIKAAIEAKNPYIMPTDDLSQWPTSIASIGYVPPPPYEEVGYIASDGNAVVPLDFVFSSDTLVAKYTFIGSVTGAWSSGNRYHGYLFNSSMANPPSDMPQADKSGFYFQCSNADRRSTLAFGYQGWWNVANADNYSYNEFHTFVLQHSTNLRQISLFTRDGVSVTQVDNSRTGNNTTSQRDPTYNSRPIVLFGRYDYSTDDGYWYPGVDVWKFGGLKIELNGQTLHDYVPALDGSTVGVWDKVNDNFFTPVGTGQLSYGSRT